MANFWERLMVEEEEMLTWTDRDSEEALVTCAWEQGCCCLFSSCSDSWVPLILPGRHFVLFVFALLHRQDKQHSLPVTPRFPLPEAQGLLLSRARAEASPGEQGQEKSIGAGSEVAGGHPVWLGVQFGWACWNQGVLSLQFQMLKLRW